MSIVSRLSAWYLGAQMGGVFISIEPVDAPRSDDHQGVCGKYSRLRLRISRSEMSTDFPDT